jgi:aryl-alcohol dehydrogenase-like predicted oxidoreductase
MLSGMDTFKLGDDGPALPRIGLGTMPMSDAYGPADHDRSVTIIQRALDLGVALVDTSDMYGAGHGERLVGQAIAGRRDDVFLATKFAARFGPRVTRSARLPRRWPSPGCSPTGSSRSRAPGTCVTWKRTSRRTASP